jgi:hypothetical protein
LFDALTSHYPPETIFMDVDSIDVGRDFIAAMHDAVVASDVVLVVIGKGWARVKNGAKGYRLYDPGDPVAFELSTALSLNKKIVPILVEQAAMPSSATLPEQLRPLLRFNGQHVRHASFRTDVRSLISSIDRLNQTPTISDHADAEAIEAVVHESDAPTSVRENALEEFRRLLRDALESRRARTREARYEVYDEGRKALADYMARRQPPLPREEVAWRTLLFEDCVIEQEARFEDPPSQPYGKQLSELDEMLAQELQAELDAARARSTD